MDGERAQLVNHLPCKYGNLSLLSLRNCVKTKQNKTKQNTTQYNTTQQKTNKTKQNKTNQDSNKTNQGVVIHICNYSFVDLEVSVSLDSWVIQPSLLDQFEVRERPCLPKLSGQVN